MTVVAPSAVLSSGNAMADEFCASFQELAADWNASLQVMVDEVTQLMMVSANCETKTFSYLKMIVFEGQLAEGWQARKQASHTQLHCNKYGMARNFGWTARDQFNDSQGLWLGPFVTSPSDCE
jgi:hypothetical protein